MLKQFPTTYCDCVICKSMCHAPCCGTPEEMEAIMDAGYGDRLCLDDWDYEIADIHPALKGYESKTAPWSVSSAQGCTFYKDGKCELHDKGLKPLGGKFAHHDQPKEDYEKLKPFLEAQWQSEKGQEIIERFTKQFLKLKEEYDYE